MNEKLIRPIFRFFNNKTKNAEFYKNHGSVWLIFTKEKRWVFELTKEGTLWYNYYLFNDVFKYFSLGVVENQQYITEWVENIIQNGVIKTKHQLNLSDLTVEDTVQNGIKHTEYGDWLDGDERLDDMIENGVKETQQEEHHRLREVVQTVKNGIKETRLEQNITEGEIDDIIQNGINETHWKRVDNHPTFVDRIIEIINPS
jgi:hypothetical protein